MNNLIVFISMSEYVFFSSSSGINQKMQRIKFLIIKIVRIKFYYDVYYDNQIHVNENLLFFLFTILLFLIKAA